VGILPGAIVFTVFGATVPSLLRQSPLLTVIGLFVLFAAIAVATYWTRNLDTAAAGERVQVDIPR